MKYNLIIDTSTKYLVIGLANETNVIDEIKYECWQRQSEFAILEIKNILERNNISVDDIYSIIVSIGPGSYTGVRIGLTIAKVFTITKNIKIKTISSLLAMCSISDKNIALIDARSDRFYVGMYNKGVKVFDDKILTSEEVKSLIKSNPDYIVVGESEKLGIEEKEINYSINMFDQSKNIKFVDDSEVDKLVPIYLKELY